MSIIDEAFEALVKKRVDYATEGHEKRIEHLERENEVLTTKLQTTLRRLGGPEMPTYRPGALAPSSVEWLTINLDKRVQDIQRLLSTVEKDKLYVIPNGTQVRTPGGVGTVVDTIVRVKVEAGRHGLGGTVDVLHNPRDVVPNIPAPKLDLDGEA